MSFPVQHAVIQSHVRNFPEIQELVFPIIEIRAATRDHVAGGQQPLHTGKVMSDCYKSSSRQHSRLLVMQDFKWLINWNKIG